MTKLHPFSFGYYRYMLKQAIKKKFSITSFVKYTPKKPKTIILRHDVDYTLNGVLDFARIEFELGCTASYLFRIHADEYNLFSCTSWKIVKDILDLGHEVGLHFEAMNVGRALRMPPVRLLHKEKRMIEVFLSRKVLTCSEHRELSGLIHNTPVYDAKRSPYKAGFKYYAMDKKYCGEMKYLSDSNACWPEGDLLQHLDRYKRFQVLIHPDWWFKDDLLLKGPYNHPRGVHI